MKNVLFALLLSSILLSCKETENPDASAMPQEWVLIGYRSGWVPEKDIVPITDSVYHYKLEADGSFVKTIGKYRMSGTYEFSTFEDRKYVNLNYDEASIQLNEEYGSWGLIHYCGQHYEPFLILDSKTIRGSWSECDGPNLYFERR
ncbi:hypothetical protein GCM10009119_04760 [Algoriphagus jejuensis]|uniref:Lipocalin-like protein n=1 Tax=Algoriphagus jejuensis TaxID=419934 RepID=A0ABP3YA85_9BACT